MSSLPSVGFTVTVSIALVGAALLAAASLRPRSMVSWLLCGYVILLAETTVLTTALSPVRLVDRAGLTVGAGTLLVASGMVWHQLGRARPPTPVQIGLGLPERLLLAGVVPSILYQAVLAISAPANNWDSLTYHLSRTAAWVQHHGIYWIPNAPTDRMNEFQPLAEQQILILFVGMGRAALFALPQLLAELAIVGAVYEAARRFRHSGRNALFAALLVATFPLVALEGTTAQNDLVAAAPVVAAAALVVGGGTTELAVGGVALGLALGVKLTTLFAVPIVLVLAVRGGRRALWIVAATGAAAFALFSSWSFVLNVVHTGALLGHGRDRLTQQASPSLSGTPTTLFRIVYDLLDNSGLSLHVTDVLAAGGVLVAAVLLVASVSREHRPRSGTAAFALVPALPLLAPRLVPIVAHGARIAARVAHLPVEDPATTGGVFLWGIDSRVSEDTSAFGAIGGPLLVLLSLWFLTRRRRDVVGLALAAALPLYLVMLSLTSKYNPWLARFLIVPVVLAAPLLAAVASRRAVATAIACVAVVELALVHVHNEQKPLSSSADRPWALTQAAALLRTFRPGYAEATAALSRLVPDRSCLGAAVGRDDPSFILYGTRFERRVRFLPLEGTAAAARAARLRYVVLGQDAPQDTFASRGWSLRPLTAARPALWTLAVAPRGVSPGSGCA